jgi:protein-disulfide isomerase
MSNANPAERPNRDERRRLAREQRQAAEAAASAGATRRRRLWQLGAILAAVVIAVAVAVAVSNSGHKTLKAGQRPAGSALVTSEFAGIPEHGTTLGDPNAPLTMHEFADLKCPICRQYSQTILPTLLKKYVRTGKLKIVFEPQHFVGEQFSPGDSGAAATFALAAAQQNRMWPFTELFYANQQDETTRYVSDAFLRQIASGVPGLNADRALAARGDAAIARQLRDAGALFDSSGFTGTPGFTIGPSGGAQEQLDTPHLTLDEFTAAIDSRLKQ